MTQFSEAYGSGSKKDIKQLILKIVLIVISVCSLAVAIWSYLGYIDQKTAVDTRVNTAVDTAVSIAKKGQADSDEVKFAQREKEPNREFVGPDDYGRLTFNYPKTWSVYVAKDVTSGSFEAYLNPIAVPTISSTQQFALRVTIKQADYSTIVAGFDALVKKGSLTSSIATVNGTSGVRLDGNFTKDIRGSEIIIKIRDKVLTMRTDANTFGADFNAIISSVKFNK